MSKISEVTNQAIQLGVPSQILQMAYQMLGAKKYQGYCEQFVEQMTGGGWKGSSAIDAWNRAQNKVSGTQGLQPGDLVYFSANKTNNGNGHTGIYAGNNQFISATSSGVLQNDLNEWQTATGQKILGYIPEGQRQSQQTPQPQQTEQTMRSPIMPPYFSTPPQYSGVSAQPYQVPISTFPSMNTYQSYNNPITFNNGLQV